MMYILETTIGNYIRKGGDELIAKIRWRLLKRKLFKINRKAGGDMDGDLVIYKGIYYYVDELSNVARNTGRKAWSTDILTQKKKIAKNCWIKMRK